MIEHQISKAGLKKRVRILLCYKNFSKECNVSHIGLGVTSAYSAKTLKRLGYHAEATPIHGTDDLGQIIDEGYKKHHRPVTHVVIMAQWIPTELLASLVRKYCNIKFVMKSHSGVGFLQAEPRAIDKLRQAIDLEQGVHNFYAGSNNKRLAGALQRMYGHPITYLPNLYYLHGQEPTHRPLYSGGTLRIGCFGSHRVYKNFSTAVAAGVEIASTLKVHAQIWINSGRTDGAGDVVYRTAKAWTRGLPHVTLKELHWASWPEFRRHIASMDLVLQPSYTETFNNVSADSLASGVPVVVGESIEWLPENFKAECDDSSQVARTGMRLLKDCNAAHDGYMALKTYVKDGIPHWEKFLRRS